jgi:hypothetical protein
MVMMTMKTAAHDKIILVKVNNGRTGISSTFSLFHYARAKAKMSWVWTYFKAIPDTIPMCYAYAFSVIKKCSTPRPRVSTGMPERHIK